MKIKVMYHSKSGNTKKVAEAIAQCLSVSAETVPAAYPLENVKLLFLGSGIYAGKINKTMKEFIRTLNASRVKNVALFGTCGSQDAALKIMRELLEEQGINVLGETFLCKGKYFIFFYHSHPSREDLLGAQEFARTVIESVKE